MRMVHSSVDHEEWVVLDSGADLSLLPSGTEAGHDLNQVPSFRLEDAQGKSLQIGGMRKVQLTFIQAFPKSSVEEECILDEEFIVANVTNPLLSLGRLLKHGWTFWCKGRERLEFCERESAWQVCWNSSFPGQRMQDSSVLQTKQFERACMCEKG